ncbi:GNAT family N-acetyltransferase [Paenibacillus sp. Marseille-Q4541]|uniref:GNAT family N-acetyltransferase n=1 Tax=Paenibacillus sp. Marseille-Q4541 TaxID=2831522 RepID=UPI001BADFE68|nr:GNAT family N-acetyltransferase [Paenibacillus sp. Marseille-Q4541]
MIRNRRPKQDDTAIMELIKTQLVPLSHMSKQDIDQVIVEIPLRLSRGITLVSSSTYESNLFGFVHFMMHGNLLYIDMMAVSPKQQRKQHGKELLLKAEHFGISRGCKKSKVMVDEGNNKAVQFYQKSGYKMIRYIDIGRCYEMEKNLDDY